MKKNKVVNLFEPPKTNESKEPKYSLLLERFISPFVKNFDYFEYQEDIFDFAINAWNLGNFKSILDKTKFEEILSIEKESADVHFPLLKKMIALKVSKFKEHTNFIIDYDVKETNDSVTFKVKTEKEETFMLHLMQEPEADDFSLEDDFEENYINRSAIAIKPLQPFIDWHNAIYPDSSIDKTAIKEVNIYLINNTYYEDVEEHLKKNFDKYFMMELKGWHTDKKAWPKKRNYKMFKQWFHIDISTAVLDLEKTPVSKSDY